MTLLDYFLEEIMSKIYPCSNILRRQCLTTCLTWKNYGMSIVNIVHITSESKGLRASLQLDGTFLRQIYVYIDIELKLSMARWSNTLWIMQRLYAWKWKNVQYLRDIGVYPMHSERDVMIHLSSKSREKPIVLKGKSLRRCIVESVTWICGCCM